MNVIYFLKITTGPVLNFLGIQVLYSSILFIFIFLLSALLRKKYSYIHLGLWTLLLIRLVLPPNLTSDISLGTVIHSLSGIGKIEYQPDVFEKDVITLTDGYSGPTEDLNQNPSPAKTFFTILLFCIWVAGICVFLGLFSVRFNKYKKIVSNSEKIWSPQYLKLVDKWKKILKITRPVHLITSHLHISPFTTGLLKPVIYVPGILLESARVEHLEAVIAHEMAHIKRYDALWIKCQNILQCIYFFHPAVWIANKKINQAREFICDGRVLMTKSIAREEYGKGLLTILKINLPGTDCPALIPGFKSPHEIMKSRIKKIKGEKLMNKTNIFTSFLFIMLAGILLLPMAGRGEKNKTATVGQSQKDNFTLMAENMKQETSPATTIKFIKPLDKYTITAQHAAVFIYNGNKIKHKGIDLKTKRGTDIYSSADGTIFKAVKTFTENKGYGKYIIVQHRDGFKTLYAHLDTVIVKEGENVTSGQVIGQVGDTGKSTGPHLHFELIHQDEHKDPADYIDF